MKIRAKILKALLHSGPMSRAELAEQIGSSNSGVTAVSATLCEQGVIYETGYQQHTGKGRKHVLLDVNISYKFAFGVGVCGGVVSVGLTTVKGDTIAKRLYYVSDSDTKSSIFDVIKKLIQQISRECCISERDVLGIGVCADSAMVERFGDDFCSLDGTLPVLFESADEYRDFLKTMRAADPAQFYMFGCAKVIRDIYIADD